MNDHIINQSIPTSVIAFPALGDDRSNDLLYRIDKRVTERYSPHPLSFGLSRTNVESVLQQYLTMSAAFPYIQAGAHRNLVINSIARGVDFDAALETTSVVAAFLVWDEFGGNAKLLAGGMPALPGILSTGSFHANLLREDIEKLTGKKATPGFSRATRNYLNALSEGLSSLDSVERVAHMVAFERHAGTMIEALWHSLQFIFGVTTGLAYFETHVGGDDPAEAYHVDMTAKMIDRIVDPNEEDRFIEYCDEAYRMNFTWCAAIKGA